MFHGCGSDLNLFVVLCFFVAGMRRTSRRSAGSQERSDFGLGQTVFCGLGGDLPLFSTGVEMIEG